MSKQSAQYYRDRRERRNQHASEVAEFGSVEWNAPTHYASGPRAGRKLHDGTRYRIHEMYFLSDGWGLSSDQIAEKIGLKRNSLRDLARQANVQPIIDLIEKERLDAQSERDDPRRGWRFGTGSQPSYRDNYVQESPFPFDYYMAS